MRKRNRSARPTDLGGAANRPSLIQTPFPGLIDGRGWDVREGRWPTFIDRTEAEGIMQVPLDDDDPARKLRLHEQAHVAWTPNISPVEMGALGPEERTIGACEDARLISMMNAQDEEWARINRGTDILPPWLIERHKADFQRLMNKLHNMDGDTRDPVSSSGPPVIPLVEAARLIASSRGYAEAQHFDRIAAESGLYWITENVERLHHKHLVEGKKKKPPTFEDTIAYARELEEFFENMEEEVERTKEALQETELPQNVSFGDLFEEEYTRWGDMNIQDVPLTERLQGDPSRRVRATDMGAIPRYMHRLPVDQKVFGRRRKHRKFQGTVLIDCSGSMSLTAEEVDEILHRWPAVTIATYSGFAAEGILRIVAKKGRRAGIQWLGPPAGGSNVIDGPALDWLNTQKGPRVWISDGWVTGIGDASAPHLTVDAAKKCARGKIKRIQNVQQLIRD